MHNTKPAWSGASGEGAWTMESLGFYTFYTWVLGSCYVPVSGHLASATGPCALCCAKKGSAPGHSPLLVWGSQHFSHAGHNLQLSLQLHSQYLLQVYPSALASDDFKGVLETKSTGLWKQTHCVITVEKANQDEIVIMIIFLMMEMAEGLSHLESLHLGSDSTSGGEGKLWYW